jgi:23S rRNA (adenine2503-C2)-methyltransferase
MVFIPDSSAARCAFPRGRLRADCSFCLTAQQGFNRNLTTAEIVGQVWLAEQELAREARSAARRRWRRPTATSATSPTPCSGLGSRWRLATWCRCCKSRWMTTALTRRGVTLRPRASCRRSKLAEETNVALAVLLHAADDELRNELGPINRKHPIAPCRPAGTTR